MTNPSIAAQPSPVLVTVALTFKPGLIDGFWRDVLPELSAGTRAFPGVRSAQAFRQAAPSNEALFIDVFESAEASDAYFGWRRSTGTLARLEALLDAPPRLETWPIGGGDSSILL